MQTLNELIHLAQQLDSVMDDLKGQILDIRISNLGQRVECHTYEEVILNTFSKFEIHTPVTSGYVATLKAYVGGIEFFALVEDPEAIRSFVTEDWLLQDDAPVVKVSRLIEGHEKSLLAMAVANKQSEQIFYSDYA